MRLMLLRHAKAEKAGPGTGDRDRPLTPRGRKDAHRLGAYLVHHSLIPDRAVVSPARRTRETWECLWERVAGASAALPPPDYDDRLYNASVAAAMDVLRHTESSSRLLLVIGHNPGLHEIAQLLIATGDVEARERLNEGLPTCGLAIIDFAGSDWRKLHPQGGRIERFVTPHSLTATTD